MVKAVVLVRSPKKLIAARLRMIKSVYDAFAVSGQFDAIALIEVKSLPQIMDVTTEIQNIKGVERTETMVQVV